jgi:hypothetical protein
MRMMLNTTKKIHVGSVMGRLWGIGNEKGEMRKEKCLAEWD